VKMRLDSRIDKSGKVLVLREGVLTDPTRGGGGRGWRERQGGYRQARPWQRFAENNYQVGIGGPPNPRFGNQGVGYKRGQDDREGGLDQRELDPRTKARRD
jgi:hypothetical protein